MDRRRFLAAAAATVTAGCTGPSLGGAVDRDSGITATSPSSTQTPEPCTSTLGVEDAPEKPDDLQSGAETVVQRVETQIAADHFDPDGHFTVSTNEVEITESGDDTRLTMRVEVDFSTAGDGADATTVHAHLFYRVEYRLTDRRVVRDSAEEGPTGTAVCW